MQHTYTINFEENLQFIQDYQYYKHYLFYGLSKGFCSTNGQKIFPQEGTVALTAAFYTIALYGMW